MNSLSLITYGMEAYIPTPLIIFPLIAEVVSTLELIGIVYTD